MSARTGAASRGARRARRRHHREQLEAVARARRCADVLHVRSALGSNAAAVREPRLAQHACRPTTAGSTRDRPAPPLSRRLAEAVAVGRDAAVVVDGLDVPVVRDQPDAVDGEDERDDERHGDRHERGDWASRARMRAIVDAAQPAAVHVAVDLRRARASCGRGAPGSRADRRRPRGGAWRRRGGGGAGGGRRGGACSCRACFRAQRERTRSRRRARAAAVPRGDTRTASKRFLTERHDALLPALAADVDELLLEVDVLEVEVDRLGARRPAE